MAAEEQKDIDFISRFLQLLDRPSQVLGLAVAYYGMLGQSNPIL